VRQMKIRLAHLTSPAQTMSLEILTAAVMIAGMTPVINMDRCQKRAAMDQASLAAVKAASQMAASLKVVLNIKRQMISQHPLNLLLNRLSQILVIMAVVVIQAAVKGVEKQPFLN
jgi:hypothetical protein